MSYTHLTLEERALIEIFVRKGKTSRGIAEHLGRHHTTISREIRRNSSKKAIVLKPLINAPKRDERCRATTVL